MTNSGNGIGRITPNDWLTRSKASKRVGRSIDTLKRWHKLGLCVPSGKMQVGKLDVWLYSEADIEKLIHLTHTQKVGRKPKQTTTESENNVELN